MCAWLLPQRQNSMIHDVKYHDHKIDEVALLATCCNTHYPDCKIIPLKLPYNERVYATSCLECNQRIFVNIEEMGECAFFSPFG